MALNVETYGRLPGDPALGTPATLARVITQTSFPTSLGVFYAANPHTITSVAAEGDAVILNQLPGVIFVNVLNKIPTSGDILICFSVAYRWVAELFKDDGGGHNLPGCGCESVPDVIYIHVGNPQTAHVTQEDSYIYSPVVSSPLRFQTRPADTIPTGTTVVNYSPAYYSDAKYEAWIYAGQWLLNGTIRFYMYCDPFSGSYSVGLIYTSDAPQSANGSNYTGNFSGLISFHAGFPGNTCTPFSMTNGAPVNNNVRARAITLDASAPP